VAWVSGPGAGKTHLAIALAHHGIARQARRVRFCSTADLVNTLEKEKRDGRSERLAESLLRMDLVILDELGDCPRMPILTSLALLPCRER
jgi:DNA replication protein DnaC